MHDKGFALSLQEDEEMTLLQPAWEKQRQRRIDILNLFKTKPEYQAFSAVRSSRPSEVRSPKTPDPTDPCSKRR